MINLDDIPDAIRELERAARLGLAGAMITEYPFEHRRYDQSEYETFWAAAAALDLPLSLHTATRRQGKIRGVGIMTLRDASSRATKAFYPALSMCDLIFSGVFERHPGLTVAIVEFELAWVPTYSPPWTIPTASATARRSTGSRTLCSRAIFSAATWYWASRRTPSAFGCAPQKSSLRDCSTMGRSLVANSSLPNSLQFCASLTRRHQRMIFTRTESSPAADVCTGMSPTVQNRPIFPI